MRHDPDPPTPASSTPDAALDAAPGAPPTAHPDLNATGSPEPLPGNGAPGREPRGRETQEREAGWRRGRERRARGRAGHAPETGRADPALAHRAFAALAENVRDYAIFLMDADGIIRFWGEGAHLIKRWTKEEAEGAHLRLLYLDGGSEDGTAEEHLAGAARDGESVGEGQRVRGDGTTFWARVTLTALKDEDGRLLGFAKVTRDLTAQRAAEMALALASSVAELDAERVARRDLAAEVEVLREENVVLNRELQSPDRPGT